MTLNDLREKLKAAYPAARQTFASMTSDKANMRQFWVEAMAAMKFNEAVPGGFLHEDLVKFIEAGRIYYHAKDHGLQSAMMLKLSQ